MAEGALVAQSAPPPRVKVALMLDQDYANYKNADKEAFQQLTQKLAGILARAALSVRLLGMYPAGVARVLIAGSVMLDISIGLPARSLRSLGNQALRFFSEAATPYVREFFGRRLGRQISAAEINVVFHCEGCVIVILEMPALVARILTGLVEMSHLPLVADPALKIMCAALVEEDDPIAALTFFGGGPVEAERTRRWEELVDAWLEYASKAGDGADGWRVGMPPVDETMAAQGKVPCSDKRAQGAVVKVPSFADMLPAWSDEHPGEQIKADTQMATEWNLQWQVGRWISRHRSHSAQVPEEQLAAFEAAVWRSRYGKAEMGDDQAAEEAERAAKKKLFIERIAAAQAAREKRMIERLAASEAAEKSLPIDLSSPPVFPALPGFATGDAACGKRTASQAERQLTKRSKVEEPQLELDTDGFLPEPALWGKFSFFHWLDMLGRIDAAQRSSSDAKIEALLAKFSAAEKEHIVVKPVYLGAVAELKNLREYPVTSGSLSKQIEHSFKFMRRDVYQWHDLKDFFEPNPKGMGYVPKKVKCKGGQIEKMYDIDHVVPRCWGGLDHPRNFVIMHRSMNRALREVMPEDKMAYFGTRNSTILRKVAQFHSELTTSRHRPGAYKQFILEEMKDW